MAQLEKIHIAPEANDAVMCAKVNPYLTTYRQDPLRFDRFTLATIAYHLKRCKKCQAELYRIGQSHLTN